MNLLTITLYNFIQITPNQQIHTLYLAVNERMIVDKMGRADATSLLLYIHLDEAESRV